MGNRDVNIGNLFFAEKTQILGLAADPHLRFFRKIIAIDHDDHAPNAAIPESSNAARIVVDCQFFKSIFTV